MSAIAGTVLGPAAPLVAVRRPGGSKIMQFTVLQDVFLLKQLQGFVGGFRDWGAGTKYRLDAPGE